MTPFTALAQAVGLSAMLNPEGSRLFPQTFVAPRHPGKPDPRWKNFDWKFTDISSGPTRFRLYFYEEESWTAEFVIPRIRRDIESLSDTFHFRPPLEFSYLLFTSLREFQQANIFFVSEGVQGITSTTENTMAIPYWGEAKAFDHISKHEMVHQFQVQKLQAPKQLRPADFAAIVPLWFIEGMAEYYSQDGVDPESRMYLRDILVHPDEKKKYTIPKFFEEGQMGFVHTYKVGQAKIDFLETEFGKDTIQKILDRAAHDNGERYGNFPGLVSDVIHQPPDVVETKWTAYLNRIYKTEADLLTKPVEDSHLLDEVGDTLDYYDISPDGKILAIREVDVLSGVASIRLMKFSDLKHQTVAARDQGPGLISLYFMQTPTLGLADDKVGYAVETTAGPEIEIRNLEKRDPEIALGSAYRIPLRQEGIIQVRSLSFSPDGKSLAIAGLTARGWVNLYVLEELGPTPVIRQLTDESYHWQTIQWGKGAILGSSDKTNNAKHGIFAIDPKNGKATQLTYPLSEQISPNGEPQNLVFQSWESGSSQIHRLIEGRETRITEVKTGLFHPKLKGDQIYAITFRSGRYRLMSLPPELTTNIQVASRPTAFEKLPPWKPELLSLREQDTGKYRPFVTSGLRIDGLFAYFASGSSGGIAASVSDLMRNYSITAELSALGNIKYTNAYTFLTSQAGRTTWTVGPYAILQPRLDNVFETNGFIRTYLHREYGALAALQYPLGAFSYVDAEVRMGGVSRNDFSDPNLADEWKTRNPGREFIVGPIFRVGYDGILYEAYSGPLQGFGILGESETSFFPGRGNVTERLRLDVAQYFQLTGRTVLALQGMAGASFGGEFRNPFLLSSDDMLRAYSFLDDRLFGNNLLAVKGELRFPIGSLFGFPPLRGLAGYDLGTIYKNAGQFGSRIASSYTGGLSLNVPPLSINFMWSHPIRTAPGPQDSSVAHFTFRYLYL
ncbi:MAG: hypothetical protein A2X94_05400 [Bdellovibrionales bacterium GWB1_55_8]|nr:MAG: hypothetical protein A2X94_05400 [Bdellovibrionales bacterium GWB1_55_8]